MKPRCAKILPLAKVPCNLPEGHKGRCKLINLKKERASARARYAAGPDSKKASAARWQQANPERKAANDRAWYAANTERAAAVHALWNEANPGRKAALTALWVEANPERVRATKGNWNKANPHSRALSSKKQYAARRGATTVPFTQAELKARMTSLGDACFYCALLGLVGPHECDDHFFPLQPSKGHRRGPHALWNLYPSCTHHNSEKHNKQPIDFINKLLAT